MIRITFNVHGMPFYKCTHASNGLCETCTEKVYKIIEKQVNKK